MGTRTGRFGRTDRLLKSRDFQRVASSGRRFGSRYFTVLVAASDWPGNGERRRLGVTVSRRVGKSVVRNRLKRCIREWFRHSRDGLRSAREVVVIARPGAGELEMAQIERILDDLLVASAGSEA